MGMGSGFDYSKSGKTEPSTEDKSILEPMGRFIWDLSKIFLLALVIIIPIRFFLFQPFVVSGSSMEPNFNHGDYLVIDEISYRLGDPKRGDVVVMRFPHNPSQFFIKRIIGLPGEKITISGGKVQILPAQGSKSFILEEDYLPTGTNTSGDLSVTLGPNQYFVLGDNRPSSSDSRVWGTLDRSDIVGRAWIRLLPLDDFSVIKQPIYALP